jgi:Mn2+/Fe2+ NRAMP family transporter
MADTPLHDLYRLRPEDVENPPSTFGGIARRTGPGLILAGSIVGSGELIATTVLGAENGYTLLWLILVSCVIKVAVQHELGRYSIGTGETPLEAFDRVPGPRLGVSWVVWCWFFMITMTLMQIGAMLGGISEILNGLAPGVPVNAWVWLLAAGTATMLILGQYRFVERFSMGLVVSFTALTVSCAVLLFKRPEYFSWASLLDGLAFHMPQGGFLTAVAVFGITGVGANELIMYPYWCIEKGYARYAGRRDGSEAWRRRALGWINVMGFDVVNCMIIYTFATVAFYLLGGGILHGMGIVPKGSEMVKLLSNMYTETLGSWSLYLFLVGAFAVLYSTLFSSTAANSRGLADFAGMLGLYDRTNYAMRVRVTRIFVVCILIVPSVYFMFIREPVLMVKIGGVAQASMLPIIAFSTIYLRYRHLPKTIIPKGWMTLALWVSSVVIAIMMGYSVLQRLLQ